MGPDQRPELRPIQPSKTNRRGFLRLGAASGGLAGVMALSPRITFAQALLPQPTDREVATTAETRVFPDKIGNLQEDYMEINNLALTHGINLNPEDLKNISAAAKKRGIALRLSVYPTQDIPGYGGEINVNRFYSDIYTTLSWDESGQYLPGVVRCGKFSASKASGIIDLSIGFMDNLDQVIGGGLFDESSLGIKDIYGERRREFLSEYLSSSVAHYIQYQSMPIVWPAIIENGASKGLPPLDQDLEIIVSPIPLLQLR